jgi:hypothetical protein
VAGHRDVSFLSSIEFEMDGAQAVVCFPLSRFLFSGPSIHIVDEGVAPGDLEDRPGHLWGHEEDRALSNILRRARAS